MKKKQIHLDLNLKPFVGQAQPRTTGPRYLCVLQLFSNSFKGQELSDIGFCVKLRKK